MQSQDVAPRPRPASAAVPGPEVGVEQAEAALVEHYPRLVRLAYLVLPPSLGRNRRVLTAHALTQRSLPRGRASGDTAVLPAQKSAARDRDGDPGYAYVRLRVLRAALEAGRPLTFRSWPTRAQLPPLLPQVWGLRLFPRSGGADELALDQRLSALSAPARAAHVLRGLEKLADADVRGMLAAAGEADPAAALAEADTVAGPGGAGGADVLSTSPEFDPCSLQARPTDLMRRRQHLKAAVAAVAAVAVCGALLGMPGDGWGPDGAAAPPYARNPAAQAALQPGKLTLVPAAAWESSARTDFSVWPARGELTGDKGLLRRALAVWARPGGSVQVSATPGTPSGAPPGPPQLLYAGVVDQSRVVLMYDGLRIARYAEAKDGTRGAALDFARVDGATTADADTVVLGRSDGNVRYLTAPWVRTAAVRDLLKAPGADGATELTRSADGVTEPFASPALQSGGCRSWNVLELTDRTGTRLSTDLGELTPARLTAGRPAAPRDASAADWSPLACSLADVRGQGVRSVNSWRYARQPLPDASGTADWLCTRTQTWRGGGPRVLAQFHAPGQRYGAVVAKAENASACGSKDPHVLAGVLWKSVKGGWYLLAAGSGDTASVRATGGVSGSAEGNLLAVRAEQGAKAGLKGTLEGGREITGLR
ncbi:hypothetical protein QFZ75_005527 [Streptomyces sp. V3I8]|uniref:hypothetical protein n=1 Tax=Streptomyces sp. V3I8 TaxID=3042279 RepID=UPI002780EE2B|nr:hypothetical protein [Streptomyces sp. V3I8]MDQ1039111.1 hypothetical protein [Streptomyces sp. V3I8]